MCQGGKAKRHLSENFSTCSNLTSQVATQLPELFTYLIHKPCRTDFDHSHRFWFPLLASRICIWSGRNLQCLLKFTVEETFFFCCLPVRCLIRFISPWRRNLQEREMTHAQSTQNTEHNKGVVASLVCCRRERSGHFYCKNFSRS